MASIDQANYTVTFAAQTTAETSTLSVTQQFRTKRSLTEAATLSVVETNNTKRSIGPEVATLSNLIQLNTKRNTSEAATLTDVYNAQTKRALAEVATLVDSIFRKTTTRSIVETVTPTEIALVNGTSLIHTHPEAVALTLTDSIFRKDITADRTEALTLSALNNAQTKRSLSVEVATLTDSIVKATAISSAETLILTDVYNAQTKHSLGVEVATLTDSIAKGTTIPSAEAITLTDSIFRKDILAERVESLSFVEARNEQVVRSLLDVASLSDQRAAQTKRSLAAEAVTLTDAITKGAGLPFSEVVTFTDIHDYVHTHPASELLTLTDAVTKGATLPFAELATLTDSILRKDIRHSEALTVTLTDVRNVQVKRALADVLTLSEPFSHFLGGHVSASESFALIDPDRVAQAFRSLVEDVDLSDAVAKLTTRDVAETVTLSFQAFSYIHTHPALEALTLTDVLKERDVFRSLAHDLTLVEARKWSTFRRLNEEALTLSLVQTNNSTKSILESFGFEEVYMNRQMNNWDVSGRISVPRLMLPGFYAGTWQTELELVRLPSKASVAVVAIRQFLEDLLILDPDSNHGFSVAALENITLTDILNNFQYFRPFAELLAFESIDRSVEVFRTLDQELVMLVEARQLASALSFLEDITLLDSIGPRDILHGATEGFTLLDQRTANLFRTIDAELVTLTDTGSRGATKPVSNIFTLADLDVKGTRSTLHNVVESFVLSNLYNVSTFRAISQSFQLLEARAFSTTRRLPDVLTLADVLATSLVVNRQFTETISLFESKKVGAFRQLVEVVVLSVVENQSTTVAFLTVMTLVDAKQALTDRALGEVLTLSDAISKATFIPLQQESFSLLDALNSSFQKTQSVVEDLTLFDSAQRQVLRALAELFVLRDQDTGSRNLQHSSSEVFSLLDSIAEFDRFRYFIEELDLSDLSRVANVKRGMANAVTLTGSVATTLAAQRLLTELVQLVDASKNARMARALAESLALTDARTFSIGKGIQHDLTLTDVRNTAIFRIMSELATLTDSITKATFIPLDPETFTVSDSFVRVLAKVQPATETINLVEAVGRGAFRSLTEFILLLDEGAGGRNLEHALLEELDLFDSASFRRFLQVVEELDLTDAGRLAATTRAIVESLNLSLDLERELVASRFLFENLQVLDASNRSVERTLDEQMDFSDDGSRHPTHPLVELITVEDDDVVRATQRMAAEIISLLEARRNEVVREFDAEVLSLAIAMTSPFNALRNPTEDLGLFDSTKKKQSRTITETLTLIDALRKDTMRSLFEDLAVDENLVKRVTRSILESIALTFAVEVFQPGLDSAGLVTAMEDLLRFIPNWLGTAYGEAILAAIDQILSDVPVDDDAFILAVKDLVHFQLNWLPKFWGPLVQRIVDAVQADRIF